MPLEEPMVDSDSYGSDTTESWESLNQGENNRTLNKNSSSNANEQSEAKTVRENERMGSGIPTSVKKTPLGPQRIRVISLKDLQRKPPLVPFSFLKKSPAGVRKVRMVKLSTPYRLFQAKNIERALNTVAIKSRKIGNKNYYVLSKPKKQSTNLEKLNAEEFVRVIENILPLDWFASSIDGGLQLVKMDTEIDMPIIEINILSDNIFVTVMGRKLPQSHQIFKGSVAAQVDGNYPLVPILEMINALLRFKVCRGYALKLDSESNERASSCKLLTKGLWETCIECCKRGSDKNILIPQNTAPKENITACGISLNKQSEKNLKIKNLGHNKSFSRRAEIKSQRCPPINISSDNQQLKKFENLPNIEVAPTSEPSSDQSQDETMRLIGLTRINNTETTIIRKSKRERKPTALVGETLTLEKNTHEFLEKNMQTLLPLFAENLNFGCYSLLPKEKLAAGCRKINQILEKWQEISDAHPDMFLEQTFPFPMEPNYNFGDLSDEELRNHLSGIINDIRLAKRKFIKTFPAFQGRLKEFKCQSNS